MFRNVFATSLRKYQVSHNTPSPRSCFPAVFLSPPWFSLGPFQVYSPPFLFLCPTPSFVHGILLFAFEVVMLVNAHANPFGAARHPLRKQASTSLSLGGQNSTQPNRVTSPHETSRRAGTAFARPLPPPCSNRPPGTGGTVSRAPRAEAMGLPC